MFDMKRLYLILCYLCCLSALYANNKVDIIYQGPRDIGDWGTIELSSIKFYDLEIGDTIYVFASKVDSTSLGSFQDHEWHTIPGLINGQAITGDYEFVVKHDELLNELKQFGLKVRGYGYTIDKIAIKHTDHLLRNTIIAASTLLFLALLAIVGDSSI